jgi:8-oxo-dGTP pyrophosphatase MutT (NUDIX family)
MFLIDDDRRVLLMHERRDIGSDSTHWITPGGGVEPGESLVQGAVREVYEETGLRVSLPGDARPIYAESVVFSIAGATYDQTNHYFLARVPSGLVVEPASHTEVERLVVVGHRWWSLAELDASDVIREPVAMVEVITRALPLESRS